MQNVYREILPGINLRVVQTDKFKTACFSASFVTRLSRADAAKNALIPQVLRRGTRKHPDMTRLSAALDTLYGARVEPEVRKFGDIQLTGIICDLITPDCVADGNSLLSDTLELALEVLLDPCVTGGSFVKEYVEGEKENLIDYLNGEINEKLSYAYREAVGVLYKNSGFGVNELGEEEDVAEITAKDLYAHYRDVLEHAPLEIFFCGNSSFDEVEACIKPILSKLKRRYDSFVSLGKPKQPEQTEICVHFDVNQANLLIGLYTPVRAGSTDQPAMHVLSVVLGGGTASKLFTHVREEKSLCYYTGAKYDKYLQAVIMYSGVDVKRVEEARGEMLKQLIACQDGDITEHELEVAKRNIINVFKNAADSALSLESYWIGESVMGLSRELDFRIARINAVTIDEVIAAAKELSNCLTYVLTGKEETYARKALPENK